MTTPYQIVLDFVQGWISPRHFEHYARGSELAKLLAGAPAPPYSDADSLYSYILGQSFSDPADLVSMQAELEFFLRQQGITAHLVPKFAELYKFCQLVQPDWLDVPVSMMRQLLEEAGAREGAELREWLRDSLQNRFRCLDQKPDWLHAPHWPIVKGQPLVFVGQLDAGTLLQQPGRFYLFFDPRTEETKTVVQIA